MRNPIRIFIPISVDKTNYNAQSLNTREIAIRLDPELFCLTLPYYESPDERLYQYKHIHLIKLPARLGTLKLLSRFIGQQDILFNLPDSRFSRIYLSLPHVIRRSYLHVQWLEGPMRENLQSVDERTRSFLQRLYLKADAVVSITDFVAETARKDFGIISKAVIPVGVDRDIFYYRKREIDGPVRVLFVGHLIERKGAHIILDAARQFKDVEFTLVGTGRDAFVTQLLDAIQRERLENVKILGPMPHDLLSDIMRDSDIMLHPSMVESFSKVVLEGASTGLPSVMFSHYLSPAVVNGETGYQVNGIDEMMKKLKLLIEDRELRLEMGRRASEHSKRFSWEHSAMQWTMLFREIYEKAFR